MITLDVPGHEQCVPLCIGVDGPVDVDADAERVVGGLIGRTASPDFLDETIAMVAGMSRVVARHAQERLADQVLVYAAWLILPEPGLLLPGPVAVLQVRPASEGDDDDAIIRHATQIDQGHHGSVDVEQLETRSGPALSVRYRPVSTVDGRRVVDEHRVVLWPRRSDGFAFELSLYVTDLVEGGLAAAPFLSLASSILIGIGAETA